MKISKSLQTILAVGLLCMAAISNASAAAMRPNILQARGADPNVDYPALTRFGPWDDRNYALTARDLTYLAPNEAEQLDPIPAFFRVLMRKANPKMAREGSAHYPRSAFNIFLKMERGFLYEGKYYRELERQSNGEYLFDSHDGIPAADFDVRLLNGEVRITTPEGSAESAVAINPANTNLVIAGVNSDVPDQRMWTSSNGGETWTLRALLPGADTCCDPTIGWSADGTIAYTASLTVCGGSGCNVTAYRSIDSGATWQSSATAPIQPVTLAGAGASDKEYLHVDTFATSPFKDNVYIAWHDGNTQRFARSTDKGLTYLPAFSVDTTNHGIGSDLASDRSGNLYFFYPTLNRAGDTDNRRIRVLKSTNGGVSFVPGVNVATLNDDFDYALPSMETRRAFIYTSADVDLSTGPFSNSIYVSWSDINAAESTTANNHSQVKVARSRDGGATWNVSIPHETADVTTVDRYQQWLKVDEIGRVHIVFYDTRNSAGRTGVDVYYSRSEDGGVTFTAPTRLTTVTSPNIADGFEWGDYNGLDLQLDHAIAIYTDNRIEGAGAGDSIDTYGIGGFTPPSGPGYTLALANASNAVCAGTPVPAQTVTVGSQQGYVSPVTLSLPGLNNAVFPTAVFGTNPVTPPGTSSLNLSTAAAATPGTYPITVHGSGAGVLVGDPPILRDAVFNVRVDGVLASPPTPTSPADAAINVAIRPTLTWAAVSGAANYVVEISTSAVFATILETGNVSAPATSYTLLSNLAPNTLYFWRVRASNGCGTTANSATFSFTTQNVVCSTSALAIPDSPAPAVTQDLVVGAGGTLNNLKVELRGTHTFVGDLVITLTKVGGPPTVRLIDRPGRADVGGSGNGCTNDNFDLVLDDSAATAVEAQCNATPPALSGNQRPNDPLAGFNGQSAAGTWRLSVQDLAGQDIGQVAQWCLQLPVPPTAPATPGAPDLTAATDSGRSNTDNVTNAADPVFTGTCQAGDSIQLKEGVTNIGAPVVCGGSGFSITATALAEGPHTLFTEATLFAITSAPSATLSITVDRTAPTAPAVTGPATPQNGVVTVAGSGGVLNADLSVREGASTVCTVLLAAAGNWTCVSTISGAGAHSILARQADAAGNVSVDSAPFSVTITDALFGDGFE